MITDPMQLQKPSHEAQLTVSACLCAIAMVVVRKDQRLTRFGHSTRKEGVSVYSFVFPGSSEMSVVMHVELEGSHCLACALQLCNALQVCKTLSNACMHVLAYLLDLYLIHIASTALKTVKRLVTTCTACISMSSHNLSSKSLLGS